MIEEKILEQDYFSSFIKEVLKDLKKDKKSFVFNQEQVDYIKDICKKSKIKLKIVFKDDIFYLSV